MKAEIGSPADMGKLVKHVRVSRKLSQQELAAHLGVSQRWLSELELGKGKQLNEKYFEILSMLGIRLSATAGADETPSSGRSEPEITKANAGTLAS